MFIEVEEAKARALLKTNPAILFLDQSGELGGAELCLQILRNFAGNAARYCFFRTAHSPRSFARERSQSSLPLCPRWQFG